MTCGQGITSERACLFHKVSIPGVALPFPPLYPRKNPQKRDKFGSKNAADFGAAGSVCTRLRPLPIRTFKYMRMRGKHVGNAARVLLSNDL